MPKVIIRVDGRTGSTYFPKDMRQEGFTGKIEGLSNALTVTFIKPGTALADVERSLRIILQDIALRRDHEAKTSPRVGGGSGASGRQKSDNPIDTKREIAPTRRHPLFVKYSRAWLSAVTGYSLGYLSRVATGKTLLRRSFIERVCSKLNQSEEELFLPDAAQVAPSPKGSEPGTEV